MKLQEFYKMLDSDDFLRTDYIVKLAYKYDWEKEYTIENEYLEYDGNQDVWVWLHDWNEGQTDVEVLGYIDIDDVDVPEPGYGTVKFKATQQDTPTGSWRIPGLHDSEED